MDNYFYETLLQEMTTPYLYEDDTTNIFSNRYMMNNKELCKQLFGYTTYIITNILPDTLARIVVFPLSRNGAKVIIMLNDNIGYTIDVYAIARRNKIIEKLIKTFANGAQDITNTISEWNGKIGYSNCFSDLTTVSFT